MAGLRRLVVSSCSGSPHAIKRYVTLYISLSHAQLNTELIGNLIAFWAFVTWIWTIVLYVLLFIFSSISRTETDNHSLAALDRLSFIMRPPRPEPQFWRRRKPHLVWFIGSGAVWGGMCLPSTLLNIERRQLTIELQV